MSGQLYKFNVENVKPDFCFVVDGKINNLSLWRDQYQGFHSTDSFALVMHVKDFDLTKKTMSPWSVSGALGTHPPRPSAAVVSAATAATKAVAKAMKAVRRQASPAGDEGRLCRTLEMAYQDHDNAWEEWEKTRKIPGGIFLTVEDRPKTIWISHYDLKCFKKVG